MSHLVGNPEDRFSLVVAQLKNDKLLFQKLFALFSDLFGIGKLCHKKISSQYRKWVGWLPC